jgi:polyhydroxyalkanoate depolymerase
MLYHVYQAQADMLAPLRRGARFWLDVWGDTEPAKRLPPAMMAGALADVFSQAVITHTRPDFGIKPVRMENREVEVRERAALTTPFGTLLHFQKDTLTQQPKVLLVAPMSGHFATLLRPTVQTMLADYDVYITDWHNARDVTLAAGRFGFEDYARHLMLFLQHLGPRVNMVAVCQPAVAALVDTSVMSARRDPNTPRTLTLMAGPIDTRRSPTRVNTLAKQRTMGDYERNSITAVPGRFPGAGRRVYPGFLQLASFMAMNADRHVNAHIAQLRRLFTGDLVAAEAHRAFYREYFAVSDLPAEFYLETVERVFQRHDLPLGQMMHDGEKVNPAAIRRTALLIVEGERDDICGVGQTMAALDLCAGIPIARKTYHLQTGAGHYGVFSGRAWQNQIYPKIRTMIEAG